MGLGEAATLPGGANEMEPWYYRRWSKPTGNGEMDLFDRATQAAFEFDLGNRSPAQ